ncbi:hypothetical protein HanRHA438_Chr08g0351721 [Helianthus annuus]|uniref:Uncharacterized protein n=1 Tax=Helianthus annuus TaxID=4232 RepID=A0A9K3IFU7_HELAN|nr:hypothetical protein HanXRQr2_Chr08g0340291 [Helianthus annuus]KAJ0897985.1 hypothetical protein HanRHA438_Chr08g0351721 [Helianthus annuus]
MQGDDIFNDPSACQDILSGLGTPFEVLRARGIPRENRINQLSSMLVGSSIMANSIMEDYKVLGHKEEEIVRLLDEVEAMAKAAREACARENEKLFRVLQEVTNLKAANAAFIKEKTVAEAVAKEAKEAEARSAKALEEADADRSNLNKAVEVQNRVTIIEEVTARTAEAEAQARDAAEARDSLISSLDQLKADRDWMHDHGIGHIVGTILDAPENASAINELKERAREAGFKAGYNECLNHVNPFYQSKFTDERSGFHGVDTEAWYVAVINAYNSLSISAIED